MQRVLILGSVTLAIAAMGVTRFQGLEDQLVELERLRKQIPTNARLVQQDIARLEGLIDEMKDSIEAAQASGELGRNVLDNNEARLQEIACILEDANNRHADSSQAVSEQLAAHAQEISDLQEGVESRWNGLSATIQATASLAEQTHSELGVLSTGTEKNEVEQWHRMVGPTVQLAGETTVGSGVLLRSTKTAEGNYETLLMTAWHVVRDIRADSFEENPPVPVCIYLENGGLRPEEAELVAHDVALDVALLRFTSSTPAPHGAALPTQQQLDQLRIFRTIYAVGCPLGNDPIPTRGELADLDHQIDGGNYWMISAPTYIGNSGGGIFDGQSRTLIGIFSKIYTHGSIRPTVVPHMGLVTPMPLIYDWLEEEGHADLIPGASPVNDTESDQQE